MSFPVTLASPCPLAHNTGQPPSHTARHTPAALTHPGEWYWKVPRGGTGGAGHVVHGERHPFDGPEQVATGQNTQVCPAARTYQDRRWSVGVFILPCWQIKPGKFCQCSRHNTLEHDDAAIQSVANSGCGWSQNRVAAAAGSGMCACN
jgi:hypothetical protein